MKNPIYFHLGIPKTGSTALQSFFHLNEKQLTKKGLYYPKTFRCKLNSHNPIGWMLVDKYDTFPNPEEADHFIRNKDKLIFELQKEINNNPSNSIIISSEILFSLESEAVDDLLDLIIGHPVKAVFYIRNMEDIALSYASYIIKDPLNGFLDYRISNLFEHVCSHFKYLYSPGPFNRFDLWKNKIGAENLIFRRYGSGLFQGGNIFADFLNIFGIPLNNEFILPEKKTNKSFVNCETLYFKDIINHLKILTPISSLNDQLSVWDKNTTGLKFNLPNSLHNTIKEYSAEINHYLLDHYLDNSFYELLHNHSHKTNSSEPYTLSFDSFINMLSYLGDNLEGFGSEFMEAINDALNRSYEERLHLNEFEKLVNSLISKNKVIALWGSGNLAERLLKKYRFLSKLPVYLLDTNSEKQGTQFWEKTILSPESIADKSIDTIIITSVKYEKEIKELIQRTYPEISTIITLSEIPKLLDILKGVGY